MSDFRDYKYDYSGQSRQNGSYGPSPGPGPNTPYNGQRPGNQPPFGQPFGRKPQQHLGDGVTVVSWLIDLGLTFAVPPLGLALMAANFFGLNFVGKGLQKILGNAAASRKEQNDFRAAARYAYGDHGTAARANNAANTAAGNTARNTAAPAQKAAAKPGDGVSDTAATVTTVLGIILLAFGVIAAVGTALSAAATVWRLITFVAVALGGGVMLLSGRKMKKKAARFRECIRVTKNQSIIQVGKLARTLGVKDTEIYDFLEEMIDRGYFGERAYIDHERGLLVVKPEDMRDVYRAEDEAKKAKAQKDAQAAETVYQRYIRQIAEADVAIEDEEMSRKIRRMQEVTEAIFREVEKHPEKKQKITRFMNYYLPTTLKLLDSYAAIEKQGVTGANTAKAKQDIERIADTLVEGYEKQLDSLYGAEAMDIAADVTVIEGMMRRDGLAGSRDFRTDDAAFRQVVNETAAAAPAAKPTAEPGARPATAPAASSLRGSQPYVSPFGAASPLAGGTAAASAGGAAAAVQEDKK